MLLLTSTSDKLQVITGSASQIDVHASWADVSGSPAAVALGRTNTRITTATTTDVVTAPAASTTRNVKYMEVSNNHASVSCVTTLQHTDGTNVIVLESVTLAPGERMAFVEGDGISIYDALGRERLPSPILPVGGGNTADVTANAADTQVSSIYLGQRWLPGSGVLFRCRMSKTAAGTAAAVYSIRSGPNNTVSDTQRVTFTGGTQTAAVDDGMFTMGVVLRPTGLDATWWFTHTGSGVGLDSIGPNAIKRAQNVQIAPFIPGPADYLSISVNPGASGVWTFQEALAIPIGLVG